MKKVDQVKILQIIILFTLTLLLIALSAFLVCWISSLSDTEDDLPTTQQALSSTQPSVTKPHYKVTQEERMLIARIVTCEADEYSLDCQKAVASVIFNRLESGKWQKDMNDDGKITVYDIIYYPNAFTPVQDGALDRCTAPSRSAYKAVDYVIQNGPTVPTQVRYFRDYYDFDWKNYANYTVIDDMHFGYFTNWEQGEW